VKTSFLLPVGAISILLIALAFALNSAGLVAVPVAMYYFIPAFGLMSFLLHQNVLRSNAKSPQRFVAAFMGATTIKLLVCAAFLGIYIYQKPEFKVQMALGVFAVYITFTIALIWSLTKVVRSDNR
jgi:hypothetical protein